ncbi:MAG TPA: EpsD family peptidyl-prolyl cis-trans isomerase [Burkholderiaceae bacterium]|nr:EpsD family peptidyl-prolyl cis-trans isomerase [Burkholderiaceae bacterium]
MIARSKRTSAFVPLRAAAVSFAMVLLVAGCGGQGNKASQTAAKVNKEEITVHQINFVLQQQRGLRPEQADAASRQVLERLIDQELAVQKADELKLDRDPRVVQALEAAKREVLARAYVDRVGEGAPKPADDEIRKYYGDKPALFKERRIYNIQELQIEAKPEQVPQLRTHLEAAKNIGEFVEWLKANDFRFAANQAVRAAEQLPLPILDAMARMKDGQAAMNPAGSGVQVVVLAGSSMQPVDFEHAKPAIEQYLLNERRRELVAKDLKDLRANAKIQYVGKFAEAPASAASGAGASVAGTSAATTAPATATSTAVVPAAPAASGGLDASSISKGMGLK